MAESGPTEPDLAESGVQPAEDPHFFALAVPGNHRMGPCGAGSAPYAPGEYGHSRRSVGRNLRGTEGVKVVFPIYLHSNRRVPR